MVGCSKSPEPKADSVVLRVSAASSLTDVLNEASKGYSKDHPGVRIELNFASSGVLQKQIDSDDSWTKLITANLTDGKPYMLWDNISCTVTSDALQRALTEQSWTDRPPHSATTVTFPLRMVHAMTCNNGQLKEDLTRRTLYVRIDRDEERPDTQTNWKIPDIMKWIVENRPLMLSHLTNVVQKWIDAGRPKAENIYTMGSYEDYVGIMGALLDFCKVPGFLSNRESFRAATDSESTLARAILTEWYSSRGFERLTSSDVRKLMVDGKLDDVLVERFGEKEGGQVRSIGRWLTGINAKVFTILIAASSEEGAPIIQAKVKVVKSETETSGTFKYFLVLLEAEGLTDNAKNNPSPHLNLESLGNGLNGLNSSETSHSENLYLEDKGLSRAHTHEGEFPLSNNPSNPSPLSPLQGLAVSFANLDRALRDGWPEGIRFADSELDDWSDRLYRLTEKASTERGWIVDAIDDAKLNESRTGFEQAINWWSAVSTKEIGA